MMSKAARPRPFWGNPAAIALLVAMAAIFLMGGARLVARFPGSYTWSELLISYRGGFVRRGLLGELGYLLEPSLGSRLTVSLLVVAAYLSVSTAVVVQASRTWSLAVLLCLASPGLLFFPVWDFEAFGRKDVFILLAFVSALWLARRMRSWAHATCAITAGYTLVALIHETAWLYYIAAIAALLLTRRDALPPPAAGRMLAAAIAYAVTGVAAMLAFKGSDAQTAEMIAAWQARVPEAYATPGAARFLALPVEASVQIVLSHQKHLITTAGYVLAFVLTGVPVALLARERWSAAEWKPGELRTLAVGAAAMLTTFAVAADWGRYTHLFWMHTLLLVLAAGSSNAPRPVARSRRALTLAALLVLAYGTSWRMRHFAPGGEVPLVPGYVLTGPLPPP